MYKESISGKEPVPHFGRGSSMFDPPYNGVYSVHSVHDDAEHARIKRLISHAFSDKAVRDVESLVLRYMDLALTQLRASITNPGTKGRVDISAWMNYLTFDIIGDLTFGSSFDCL